METLKYEVFLTETARDDLISIFRYIALELQSVQSATGQLSRIERAVAFLAQMPERFRVYKKENRWNVHVMPVNRYLVFYIFSNENRNVTVLRILYGGRNIRDDCFRLLEMD